MGYFNNLSGQKIFESIYKYIDKYFLNKTTSETQTVEGKVKFREELIVIRTDGTIAGKLLADDNSQYGFIVGGLDDEFNLTNFALAGSNVYIAGDSQFVNNNAALPMDI